MDGMPRAICRKRHHQSDAADSSDSSSDVGILRPFSAVVIMRFSGNMAHRLEKLKRRWPR